MEAQVIRELARDIAIEKGGAEAAAFLREMGVAASPGGGDGTVTETVTEEQQRKGLVGEPVNAVAGKHGVAVVEQIDDDAFIVSHEGELFGKSDSFGSNAEPYSSQSWATRLAQSLVDKGIEGVLGDAYDPDGDGGKTATEDRDPGFTLLSDTAPEEWPADTWAPNNSPYQGHVDLGPEKELSGLLENLADVDVPAWLLPVQRTRDVFFYVLDDEFDPANPDPAHVHGRGSGNTLASGATPYWSYSGACNNKHSPIDPPGKNNPIDKALGKSARMK